MATELNPFSQNFSIHMSAASDMWVQISPFSQILKLNNFTNCKRSARSSTTSSLGNQYFQLLLWPLNIICAAVVPLIPSNTKDMFCVHG